MVFTQGNARLNPHTALSGYRIMWLIVMFDLPVMTASERKAATKFRNDLLDLGFEMSQFSVYFRFCASDKRGKTLCKAVESALPEQGRVSIILITDKQYERIVGFTGKAREPPPKNPEQFSFF